MGWFITRRILTSRRRSSAPLLPPVLSAVSSTSTDSLSSTASTTSVAPVNAPPLYHGHHHHHALFFHPPKSHFQQPLPAFYGGSSNSRRSNSSWRNPFLVFILSFFALGTLRFRTPTRQRFVRLRERFQARAGAPALSVERVVSASALSVDDTIARSRLNISQPRDKDTRRKRPGKTKGIMELPPFPSLEYRVAERGKTDSGLSFQRYEAFWVVPRIDNQTASNGESRNASAQVLFNDSPDWRHWVVSRTRRSRNGKSLSEKQASEYLAQHRSGDQATFQEWMDFIVMESSLARRHSSGSNSVDSPGDEGTITVAGPTLRQHSYQIVLDFVQVLHDAPYAAFYFETPGLLIPAASEHAKNGTLEAVGGRDPAQTPFEFVLVDAPALHSFATGRPDSQAFADHFSHCDQAEPSKRKKDDWYTLLYQMGCVFTNLAGDSTLIAPKPLSAATADHNKEPIVVSPVANRSLARKRSRSSPHGDLNDSYSHLAQFVRHAPAEQAVRVVQLAVRTLQDRLQQQRATKMTWFSTSGTGVAWLHFRVDPRPKYYTYQPYK
jgi:hypothetical protein